MYLVPGPQLPATVRVKRMSRHLGLLILAVSVISYLEAIHDDWVKMTPVESGGRFLYTRPRMLKRSSYDKRKEVPWTRLKRSESAWTRMRRSEADEDDWMEDKRGHAWTRLKKDNGGGVTFSDWARLKREHEQWTRMKREQGVLTFTDWARLKRGSGEWTRLKRGEEAEHWSRLDPRKCAMCIAEEEEDGVNEDKVKLWTRLRRSPAGDEEAWTRLKRSKLIGEGGAGETGWVRMM